MHLRHLLLRCLALCCCVLNAVAQPSPAPQRRDPPATAAELQRGYRDGVIIAKPRPTAVGAALDRAEAGNHLRLRRQLRHVGNLRILELTGSAKVEGSIEALKASGLYEYVEPDYVRHRLATPNDPRLGEQWALTKIGAPAAWDIRSAAPDTIVAVLDSGVRYTHQDLAANMWRNPAEVAGNGLDDDGNGYIDDVHGINSLVTVGTAGSGDPMDDQGHGTSVASAAGAVGNNGTGITGVAWTVKLMALKFDDADGILGSSGFISNAVECIDYAIAKKAHILNISYGSTWYSNAERDALQRARDAGMVVVVAAGNDGVENDFSLSYPAGYLLDNVVAVANSTTDDSLSPSSTYGGMTELAAPGTDILVAARESDSAYRTVGGTSLSSPILAGAFALMRAQFPGDTPRQLINRVLRSVDPVAALAGKVQTGGRLNLARALASANTRPFNDDFANRARVSGAAVASRGSNVAATSEGGEPVHAAAGGTSLWWSWTAPSSGIAVVDTRGSTFDTTLAVYTGGAVGSLTPVASVDDAGGGTTSRLTFNAAANTTYHLAVDGKGGATGMAALAISLRPQNDDFGGAIALTGPSVLTLGNTLNASRQAGEPTVSTGEAAGSGFTVWYKWTAPSTSDFSVVAKSDSFNSVVGVYTGSSVNALTLVEAGETAVTFAATAGRVYYFAVDSSSSAAGSFTLSVLQAYFALQIGATVPTSPAAGSGSALIFASGGGNLLYTDNQTYWFKKIAGDMDVSTPAVGSDGTIYVTTTRGLFAVGTNQAVKWERRYESGISGSPAIGPNGTVIVHTDDGFLRGISSGGSELWTTAVPGASYSSPSIGSDGVIYIGAEDNQVYAVSSADGALRWKYDAGGAVYASVSIGSDGTLYVGTLEGRFHAITSAGARKWVYTTGGAISSSAAIGADGTLYFGSYDKKLYALTSTGTLKWSYETAGEIRASSPAVAQDGTVYIGSYDYQLHAVGSDGKVKQTYPTGGPVRSSPLLIDGNLMFGSEDGLIYFLFPQTLTANSAWPMHRQNTRRTGYLTSTSAPVISAQPASRAVATGGTVTLSVSVTGQAPFTYQWYKDGAAIDGATAPTYRISSASAASAGRYTVVVTNSLGSVTSNAATITVADGNSLGRLINLSARAVAGTAENTLIVGIALSEGNAPKDLLVRGVGPSLSSHGVTNPLIDPKITLYHGQTVHSSNDNWGGDAQITAVGDQVGAGVYDGAASKDAALLASLPAGTTYTAHVNAATGNSSGVALAEFYDASTLYTSATARLVNISARSRVGTGSDVLIVGFVIGGSTPRRVLIRGIGQPLSRAPYNLTGVLANPQLQLFRAGETQPMETNDDWGTSANVAELQATMTAVGASLTPDAKDAVLMVDLPPGGYTAIISGVGSATGVALAEVYEVP